MAWDFSPERPIYSQLIEQIGILIVTGVFLPGNRLPSVRELANQARVNPNTMQRALSELEVQGLVFSERTSGRFVTQDQERIEAMRKDLATERIRQFFASMQHLGISRAQALAMAAQKIEEVQDGNDGE